MNEIVLYSARRCPFAFRTRLVLKEKGLAYRHIEIDLDDKPEDFLRVSPHAKVPVLLDGATRVYESAVINEYLDEAYPEPPLMPKTPAARAHVREWVAFANDLLFPANYRFRRGPEDRRAEARATLEKHLARLDEEIGDKPWIDGEEITLADIASLPVCALLSRTPGFDLGAFPKVAAWFARAAARPAYVATGGFGRPPTAPAT